MCVCVAQNLILQLHLQQQILSLSRHFSLFFPLVRLHILSTPYTEISPALCSFNHLTLHSFMQFRKAFRVQVEGKNFQNKKVKQSMQATTDIRSSAESSLHRGHFISKLKCDTTAIVLRQPLDLHIFMTKNQEVCLREKEITQVFFFFFIT